MSNNFYNQSYGQSYDQSSSQPYSQSSGQPYGQSSSQPYNQYLPPKKDKKEQILNGIYLGSTIAGIIIFTWIVYSYKILKYSPDRVGNLMTILYTADQEVQKSIDKTQFLNYGAVNIDFDNYKATGEMQLHPNNNPSEVISNNVITYDIMKNCPDFSTNCVNV
jgi:hypothetical protein